MLPKRTSVRICERIVLRGSCSVKGQKRRLLCYYVLYQRDIDMGDTGNNDLILLPLVPSRKTTTRDCGRQRKREYLIPMTI